MFIDDVGYSYGLGLWWDYEIEAVADSWLKVSFELSSMSAFGLLDSIIPASLFYCSIFFFILAFMIAKSELSVYVHASTISTIGFFFFTLESDFSCCGGFLLTIGFYFSASSTFFAFSKSF